MTSVAAPADGPHAPLRSGAKRWHMQFGVDCVDVFRAQAQDFGQIIQPLRLGLRIQINPHHRQSLDLRLRLGPFSAAVGGT